MSNSRRDFLRSAGLLAAGASLLDLAQPSRVLAQEEPKQDKQDNQPTERERQAAADGEWVAALGGIKDLNEKEPVLVKAEFLDSLGTEQDAEKLYVRWEKINADTGRWIVLSAICTHLKCTIEFVPSEGRFICPCHGSEYDLDGEVLKRPSRKHLKDYSDLVYEEDGKLKLKRNTE